MSGSIRFTIVAGTDRKPLVLTNKDADVSFFFSHDLFVISQMHHSKFISPHTVYMNL